MSTSPKHKTSSAEDTRERLIGAATALFAERGFDGTSVKELADAAGVNVSLVSYHFGGKEGLYKTCLEHFGKQRLAVAQRVLRPPKSAEELKLRLRMFAEEMFACHIEDADRSRIVHRECDLEMPVAQEVFRETFLKVFETLVTFISSAQEAGLIRKNLNPLTSTAFIFGGLVHFMHTEKIAEKFFGISLKDETNRNRIIEHFISITLNGVTEERSAP